MHTHTEAAYETERWIEKCTNQQLFLSKSCFTILCVALCQIQSHFTSLSIIIMESFRFLSLSISATFWIETSRVHVVRLAAFAAIFLCIHSFRRCFFFHSVTLWHLVISVSFHSVWRVSLGCVLDFVHANLNTGNVFVLRTASEFWSRERLI